MFELYQLRYFLAVVETGSFTKAAERVNVTQPTLSAGIKKLEQQLDVDLFQRSSRRVFLTEAGTKFVKRAKSILYECNQAQVELSAVVAPSVLRLGVLRTVPAKLVGRLLADYRRHDATVIIELFEGTEQEIQNRLDEGSIDLAITITRGQEADGNSQPIILLEEPYLLALSATHPLAGFDQVEVQDLAQDSMVVRSRCEILSETSRFFTDANVRPRLAFRTEQDERAMQMVAAGLGVTVVPASYRVEGVVKRVLTNFHYRRNVGLKRSPHPINQDTLKLIESFTQFAGSQNWQDIPIKYST